MGGAAGHETRDYLSQDVLQFCVHTAIVISPLTALVRDQVTKYGPLLRCACIGEETNEEDKSTSRVLLGDYQLVYTSPEATLGVTQWRDMLRSPACQDNVVAIDGVLDCAFDLLAGHYPTQPRNLHSSALIRANWSSTYPNAR